MSNTSETANALVAILDRTGTLFGGNAPEELVKLCRKLERERDYAREQLDAERALADRLALQLKPLLIATWREKSPSKAELAMEAWKEARDGSR